MTDADSSIDAFTASQHPGNPATGTHIMGERMCGWCAHTFPIVRRPGRPQIYCNRSCRQRAYERRRGLGVLPPPDRIIMQPGGPLGHLGHPRPAYELGHITFGRGMHHAMRPSGILDHTGRRLTLCGLLARSLPREFGGVGDRSCRTCDAVTRIRPPGRQVRPSADLAALRSLLDAAAIELDRGLQSMHPVRGPGEILTELLLAA